MTKTELKKLIVKMPGEPPKVVEAALKWKRDLLKLFPSDTEGIWCYQTYDPDIFAVVDGESYINPKKYRYNFTLDAPKRQEIRGAAVIALIKPREDLHKPIYDFKLGSLSDEQIAYFMGLF